MPTLATGISTSSARAAARGFTLLELLVVLVIIGVVIAGTVLAIGSPDTDSEIEQERERLASLLQYAQERAGLQVTEYGLRLTPGGYAFSYYDARAATWQAESLDDLLRPRTLPAGLAFRLDIEGRRVVLEAPRLPQGELQTVEDYTPQIMLFANGDTNDFALTMERSGLGRQFTFRSTGDGGIEYGTVTAESAP